LIEEIELSQLEERERYWIKEYNSYHNGYNATYGGDGKQLYDYDFIVNGVKFSGKSRYSHLNPPYPQEGDSIDVYYDEKDPNINLWSGEFAE
ncbi:MAG: hypothetical protein II422_01780, partial [Prevotella sp.]|nr:hypothetical protein [Prevotella sp.]